MTLPSLPIEVIFLSLLILLGVCFSVVYSLGWERGYDSGKMRSDSNNRQVISDLQDKLEKPLTERSFNRMDIRNMRMYNAKLTRDESRLPENIIEHWVEIFFHREATFNGLAYDQKFSILIEKETAEQMARSIDSLSKGMKEAHVLPPYFER